MRLSEMTEAQRERAIRWMVEEAEYFRAKSPEAGAAVAANAAMLEWHALPAEMKAEVMGES